MLWKLKFNVLYFSSHEVHMHIHMYVLYTFTICVLAQHIGHYGQVLPGRSCVKCAHSVGRSLRITRSQKHEELARLKLRAGLRWTGDYD